jgi:hypothetical protein
MGFFARKMKGMAPKGTEQKTIMIDATYLKADRTFFEPGREKVGPDDQRGRMIGRSATILKRPTGSFPSARAG